MLGIDNIKNFDSEIYDAMQSELDRQQLNIELIASENIVSKNVMYAMGSILTNKYAEGYPAKRYYGGCEHVDTVEKIAIDRAKKLFSAEHVNVQPHSGSQANMAVYFSLLESGDTVLGMSLENGGHLTHGSPVNISGKYFNFISYGLNDKNVIDYDNIRNLALKYKPKLIIAGASAYSREIDFKIFREIADLCGAYLMVDMAHIAGLIAADLHMSPMPYADVVTTTTHKTLRGPRGGMILCKEKFAKQIDKAIFPGIQGGPLMHIIASKAICFKEALSDDFKVYQKNVVDNAKALEIALKSHNIDLVSDGTDNHLLLIDLSKFDITGKQLEINLGEANITVNKNMIPNDKTSPFITSGIRIGTPAITSRGFKTSDMEDIAKFIYLAITDFDNSKDFIKNNVIEMCKKYPIYNY